MKRLSNLGACTAVAVLLAINQRAWAFPSSGSCDMPEHYRDTGSSYETESQCNDDCLRNSQKGYYSCVTAGKGNSGAVYRCSHPEISPGTDRFCLGVRDWCTHNMNDPDNRIDCQYYAQSTSGNDLNGVSVSANNWTSYPRDFHGFVEYDLGQRWAQYRWHIKYAGVDLTTSCLINHGNNEWDLYPIFAENTNFCNGVNEWCREQGFNDLINRRQCKANAMSWVRKSPYDQSKTLNARTMTADDDRSRGRAWAKFWWDYNHGKTPTIPTGTLQP